MAPEGATTDLRRRFAGLRSFLLQGAGYGSEYATQSCSESGDGTDDDDGDERRDHAVLDRGYAAFISA